MLTKLRKAAGTWVMAIFSFLIILSFAVWGIGDIFRGRTSNTVATVGDHEIASVTLSREFQTEMNRLRSLFGGQLDSEQARNLGLVDRALDALVARALYDLEASRFGLVVSDSQVADEIRDTRGFKNTLGEFDRSIFESVLAQNNMTEQYYVQTLRDNLRRTQLIDSVAAGAGAPNILVENLYRHRSERRAVEFFVLRNDAMEGIDEPTEQTLRDFHANQSDRFTAPEYRRLSFVHIAPEDLAGEVAVAEEDIVAEYDDRLDFFVTPEKRNIDQILFSDADRARAARVRLMAGEDFFAIALELANQDQGEVTLGPTSRSELIDEFGAPVFALAEGEISEAIETPFGWHIFRVTAIEPETVQPLADVREVLRRDIALRNAVDALYKLTNRLDDTLAGGASLDDAAGQLQLRLSKIAVVDDLGNTADGARAEGLPGAPEFLPTAFATPEGQTSLLAESEDGSYFILRVDGVTRPALRAFDTVRDEVIVAWRGAEAAALAAERGEDAARRINGGESFAALAKELGVTAKVSAPVRRDGAGADRTFSFDIINAMFSLDIGGAANAPAGDGSGHLVARLSEIVAADPAADAQGVEAMRVEIGNSIARDLAEQYQAMLEKRFPVTVNRGAIDALF